MQKNIFQKLISVKPNTLLLLEFFHSPNFVLLILFNNRFTLISDDVFWIEGSPPLAVEALHFDLDHIQS